MRLPFSKELDETFRSDRSAWIKMVAAALVADFCVVLGIWKMRNKDVPIDDFLKSLNLGILAIVAAAGAGTALLLSLKDVIRRRIDRGDSVNFCSSSISGWAFGRWWPGSRRGSSSVSS